jgi:glycosyltransferase involved in cell wall biosynthesis
MTSAKNRSDVASAPVTVFLPVYNEADSIAQVLREFTETVVAPLNADLLVCEDGSTDGTDKVLQQLSAELPMRLVSSRTRKGFAGAVRDGLKLAKSDLVFFADSDGQYDPKDFWKIWQARDSYDLVIGRKMHREEGFYRTLLSRGFHLLVKAFTTVPLEDMDCGFRLIRREVVQEVLPEVRSLEFSFNAEFAIIAYRKGFRILETPISHRPSMQGDTSIYTWNKMPRIIVAQLVGLLRLANRLNRSPGVAQAPSRSGSAQS